MGLFEIIKALIKNKGVRAAIQSYGKAVVDRVRGKTDDVRWTQADQKFIEENIKRHGFQETKNLLEDSKMLGPLIRNKKKPDNFKKGGVVVKKRKTKKYKKGGAVVKKPVKKTRRKKK